MEILIIFALAYGIMRSIHHGAVNTAAIVRGREPVYVPRRRPVAASGPAPATTAGGPGMGTAMTAAVVGGVGRGTSGVLAASKDALVDGVRMGWGEGKAWYAKRQRAKKGTPRDGQETDDAPVLETRPTDDTAQRTTDHADPAAEVHDAGELNDDGDDVVHEHTEQPRLRLVQPSDSEPETLQPEPRTRSDGEEPTDHAPDRAESPIPAAPSTPLQRADTKENVPMTMTSGETTTIDSTRAYLGELTTHVGTQIVPQLELCQAHLQKADMDPTTLGHLAQALEQFQVAQATVTAALDALNSQHALMEEAVNSTQHAAERDYYKHQ